MKKLLIILVSSMFMFSCSKHIDKNMLGEGINKKPGVHQRVNEFNEKDFYGKNLKELAEEYNNVIVCAKVKSKDKKIELGCTSHHFTFKCNIDGKDSKECLKKFKQTLKNESKYY